MDIDKIANDVTAQADAKWGAFRRFVSKHPTTGGCVFFAAGILVGTLLTAWAMG